MATPDEKRESLVGLVICVALLLAAALASAAWGQCPDGKCPLQRKSAPVVLIDGTILLSRNADERENTTPGHYNHAAIVAGPDVIVESQRGQGVITTSFSAFLSRKYSRIVAFKPKDAEAGKRAATRARAIVGKKHGELSSLFRGRGLVTDQANCVTAAVEIPWGPEHRATRGIVLPDGMLRQRVKEPFLAMEVVR